MAATRKPTPPPADEAELDLADVNVPGVIQLTPDETLAFFDQQARAMLGISGEEFLRRYDAGEYDEMLDLPEHSDLIYLALMSVAVR